MGVAILDAMTGAPPSITRAMLDLAARCALRAAGDVEPNPLVGCVLVKGGAIIGLGHHRRFGGLHAETEALADCRRRGKDPAGATAYVTLEPCAHVGKQPACAAALIGARIGRVVCARRDPNPVSAGGAAMLRAAGIAFEYTEASRAATHLSDPFVKRVTTGMPWVIAKWAQTIDGRIATRTGESQWISADPARLEVHRLRARVDCILTAIGTVLADDPQLTARGVARVRRIARRVIVDPRLEMPPASAIMATIDLAPVTIATTPGALAASAEQAAALRSRGAEVIALEGTPLQGARQARPSAVPLAALLRHLAGTHDATNVLVEAGPRLLGRLLDEDLADELRVYVAPLILADGEAAPAAAGRVAAALADARRYELVRTRALGPDVRLAYRRPSGA